MPPESNHYADFDKDLREGQAREDAFVHVLLRSRVEHKRDKKCAATGNVAIEYQQRCKDGVVRDSGIADTKADRYAIEYRPECWLVLPTEEVQQLAREAIRQGKHRWIGNGDNHHNALVPISWFVSPPSAQARLEVAA